MHNDVEFGTVLYDIDGCHVIGVVNGFTQSKLTKIRVMHFDTTFEIELLTESIAIKDGKPCVNWRWA